MSRSAVSAVASVLPSSTMTISQSRNVWATTLATVSGRYWAWLKQGMTTETVGGSTSGSSAGLRSIGPSMRSATLASPTLPSDDAPVERADPGLQPRAGSPRASHEVAHAAARGEEGRVVSRDLAEQLTLAADGLHVPRVGTLPVAPQRFGDAPAHEPTLGRADPEVPVLVAPAHVRVVAADGLPDLAAEEGDTAELVLVQEPVEVPETSLHALGLRPEVLVVGVCHRDGWIRIHQGHSLLH